MNVKLIWKNTIYCCLYRIYSTIYYCDNSIIKILQKVTSEYNKFVIFMYTKVFEYWYILIFENLSNLKILIEMINWNFTILFFLNESMCKAWQMRTIFYIKLKSKVSMFISFFSMHITLQYRDNDRNFSRGKYF